MVYSTLLMLEVNIHREDVIAAAEMALDMGAIRNSITRGQGNLSGFLGESIILRHLGGVYSPCKDYDIISESGMKIDVKTKRTSAEPLEYYQCSVASTSLHQKCDAYAFVRVMNDMTRGWVLGLITRDEFFSNAVFYKKGEKEGDNGFTVKQDCYSMTIKDINEKSTIQWKNLKG